MRFLTAKWNRRGEPPRRSAAPLAVASRIPGRYHHTAILWTKLERGRLVDRLPSDDIGRKGKRQ
jgi:hypothetical protein